MRNALRLGILACIAILAGCAGSDRHAASTAADTARADTAAAAAALPLEPIDGSRVLAIARDGRARATVVNVWATWCEPCRQEFPEMLAAARAHRGDGVRLVLVSADFDDQVPAVRRFLAANGVSDTTYLKHDPDQAFLDTLDRAWTGTIPATFVYDAAGRRVAFWEGRASRTKFEDAIRRALAAAPPTNPERNS